MKLANKSYRERQQLLFSDESKYILARPDDRLLESRDAGEKLQGTAMAAFPTLVS